MLPKNLRLERLLIRGNITHAKDKGANAREVVLQEALARQGAQETLLSALNEEVEAYLSRGRYERTGMYGGHRNGTTLRWLTLGTVELNVPHIRDVSAVPGSAG